MLLVLLVLMTVAVLAACLLMGLMFYRDEPMLGVYGLTLGLFAGMISMAYGALAFA